MYKIMLIEEVDWSVLRVCCIARVGFLALHVINAHEGFNPLSVAITDGGMAEKFSYDICRCTVFNTYAVCGTILFCYLLIKHSESSATQESRLSSLSETKKRRTRTRCSSCC